MTTTAATSSPCRTLLTTRSMRSKLNVPVRISREERLSRARAPTFAVGRQARLLPVFPRGRRSKLIQCTRFEATCKDVKLKDADGGTVSQSLALVNEIYLQMESQFVPISTHTAPEWIIHFLRSTEQSRQLSSNSIVRLEVLVIGPIIDWLIYTSATAVPYPEGLPAVLNPTYCPNYPSCKVYAPCLVAHQSWNPPLQCKATRTLSPISSFLADVCIPVLLRSAWTL